jgi:hypothetical protein
MIYLDVLAGITGLILSSLVIKGVDNFEFTKMNYYIVPVVLISRLIIDYIYHSFVSKTDFFGGSLNEFVFSSILWFVLIKFVLPLISTQSLSNNHILIIFAASVIMMFAIARVTNWG